MSTATTPSPAAETFASCATFYDALTAHHHYEELADLLESLLAKHGHHGRAMLDLACGTGKSFLPFVQRGYNVTACDISPEMLEHAKHKANGGAELLVADMRDLPELGPFDLVTCIDEPVNYLLTLEEVASCFASIERSLRPGGLAIFDLNTLNSYRTIFARDECYEQEGWLFVWRGHGNEDAAPGSVSGFSIEAFTETSPDSWQRLTNQHLQRHYPIAETRRLLADAGLDCARIYGITPDGTLYDLPDENSQTKLFYIARKPA